MMYKTAAQHRETPLHLHEFRVQQDGVYAVCSRRYEEPDVIADPAAPYGRRLRAKRLPESAVLFADLTDDENKLLRDACILVETKVAEQATVDKKARAEQLRAELAALEETP